ncbi:Protein yellow [Blattella germanica]|nr:Protein yellow [Blattella germanica]
MSSELSESPLCSGNKKSPPLVPYPNWKAHDLGRRANQGMNIVSPFRMRADSCDRLWVLDTGMTDILGNVENFGPNQLLVFDLLSDQLLRKFIVPKDFLTAKSFFANLAVDVKWTDGLFGLALSKEHHHDGFRTLYFHPFSSFSEFSVSTRVLQNESLWTDPREMGSTYHEFESLGSRGTRSQSSASFLDEESGVLFYTQVTQNAVSCWNTRHAYTPATQGQVAVDDITMVFPNDLKVDSDRNLWVLTDRMPLFLYGNLNFSDVNFRVLSAPVDEAIAHTICSSTSGQSPLSSFGAIIFVVSFWCLKVQL